VWWCESVWLGRGGEQRGGSTWHEHMEVFSKMLSCFAQCQSYRLHLCLCDAEGQHCRFTMMPTASLLLQAS